MTHAIRNGQMKQVLLVEDNPADVALARAAFDEGQFAAHLRHVSNGQAALDFLRHTVSNRDAPRPDLVLLDWNMPMKDGFETLKEIRQDPDLRSLVVVVLTTSRSIKDVQNAYALNVNAYVPKPVDLDEFVDAIRTLQQFFFDIAMLPTDSCDVAGRN